jgi:hypothetical protein
MARLDFLHSFERNFLRRILQGARHRVQKSILSWQQPAALAFYDAVLKDGYLPNDLIDIVPKRNVLYIANPKAACTRVRATLAFFLGRDVVTDWDPTRNWAVHNRSASGLRAPRHNIAEFYRVATDQSALRFSFVRNPYDRIVSCWIDQYKDKALVPNETGYIDSYLAHRTAVSKTLPAGPSETLSFPQFAEFVLGVDGRVPPAISMHWYPQAKILRAPGMELNFIGKVENFATDFNHVLDFFDASGEDRARLVQPLHHSRRRPVAEYLSADLAARIYAAYEEDFDRFGYSRAIPT